MGLFCQSAGAVELSLANIELTQLLSDLFVSHKSHNLASSQTKILSDIMTQSLINCIQWSMVDQSDNILTHTTMSEI